MIQPLKLFGTVVGWYPVMATLSAVAAAIFCAVYASRYRLFPSRWTSVLYALCMAVVGVVVARVWSVAAFTWTSESYGSMAAFYAMLSPQEILTRGGLVWYGGFLPVTAWLLSLCWTSMRGQRAWQLFDVTALMSCLAYPIARTGCFLTGCCYGKWSDLPWAVYVRYGSDFSLMPRHPTNAYEAGLHSLLFAALLRHDGKKPAPGTTAMAFVAGHAAIRFFMEFIRTHPVVAYGLTSRQFISLGLIGLALWTRRWLTRRAWAPEDGGWALGAAALNWRMASSAVAVIALSITTMVTIDVLAMQPRAMQARQEDGRQIAERILTLDGEAVSLDDYRGAPLVLNFWATWCVPCREEIPDLVAFSRRRQDVPVLGIASGEHPDRLRISALQLGISYPVLRAGDRILERFGVLALPRTVVLDARGEISGVHSGPITLEELEELVLRAGK